MLSACGIFLAQQESGILSLLRRIRIYIEDTPANGGIGCGTELPLL